MSPLCEILHERDIVIICGAGGVGKTTVAAAIGLAQAMYEEGDVLVLTVDPARRLASALGIADLGGQQQEVPLADLFPGGEGPAGRLWMAMLDTGAAWDQLIERHAPSAEVRDAILTNRLYRNLTTRFIQAHDYIAVERLLDVDQSGRFDCVVVDTPPSGHAIDVLRSPQRISEFFSSRLLKWLVAPARSRVLTSATRPLTALATRILGGRFLSDITDFFVLLETMRPGFLQRAEEVAELLRADRSTFLAVAGPDQGPLREASALGESLRREGFGLGGYVLNRLLPEALLDKEGQQLSAHLASESASTAAAVERAWAEGGTPTAERQRTLDAVLGELGRNHSRLSALAVAQRRRIAELAEPPVVLLPLIDQELGPTDTIARLAALLWDPPGTGARPHKPPPG